VLLVTDAVIVLTERRKRLRANEKSLG
jgi:hypothetical protein